MGALRGSVPMPLGLGLGEMGPLGGLRRGGAEGTFY